MEAVDHNPDILAGVDISKEISLSTEDEKISSLGTWLSSKAKWKCPGSAKV